MKLSNVVDSLENLVPLRFAESWDNVGLLVGDREQDVSSVLLCIDLTPEVLAETERHRCELVIAYHPPIFDGLKRLGPGTIAFDLARRGIACWSPHTALDVADGGTNDVLAEALGLRDAEPLRVTPPASRECKLVTFVPEEQAERVATALFETGAGVIGQYQSCSFRSVGTGTFLGGEGTNPAVGERGRLERVSEIRLETVAPLVRIPEIVAALRKAHPYEEPAFDLVALQALPETRGIGRIGDVDRATVGELVAKVKQALSLDAVLLAGDPSHVVDRAACAAGSCGDLWKEAASRGAQLLLTGELRHHDALAASRRGLAVIATLHSRSERAALPRLAVAISERLPLSVRVSEIDVDPFRFA